VTAIAGVESETARAAGAITGAEHAISRGTSGATAAGCGARVA
jgi:hypothetical protein